MRVSAAGGFSPEAAEADVGAETELIRVPSHWPVRLDLKPGVACAGTFSVASELVVPRFTGPYLRSRSATGDRPRSRYLHLDRERRNERFNIAGLTPDRYEVSYSCGDAGSAPIEFVLPPEGSHQLEFEFVNP